MASTQFNVNITPSTSSPAVTPTNDAATASALLQAASLAAAAIHLLDKRAVLLPHVNAIIANGKAQSADELAAQRASVQLAYALLGFADIAGPGAAMQYIAGKLAERSGGAIGS